MEIFVKGDAVTENDAQKPGDFLADLWKDTTNMKSLQLTKDKGAFVVKMVVGEKKVTTDSSFNSAFTAIKKLLETEVFKYGLVNFIITDSRFNEIKGY